jgi:two-component system, chemotaxis family, chemotaxis protein CheY
MHSLDISDLAILLIEPSPMQAKVISTHLCNEGVKMIEMAHTGADGLTAIRSSRPDLVISSMYLPDMSATELLVAIKDDVEIADLPFMLISSETSYAMLDTIRQAGVIAILPKPFDHEDLKRALRATIEFIDPQEIELEHYEVESLRVLVVDDSKLARNHISRVLKNLGIQCIEEAQNGKEALRMFSQAEELFDLIVTDYNMPEMDGQELIHYIRNELQNSFIPILMVTSEQNHSRLSNIQKAGVSAICDKPFEPQTVKEMLYRVLEG